MPFIIAALLDGLEWLLTTRLGLFVAQAMLWLGINFATVKYAVQPALDLLRNSATPGALGGTQFSQLAIAWLGVLQFDRALTMIISAYAARYVATQGKAFLQIKSAAAGQ